MYQPIGVSRIARLSGPPHQVGPTNEQVWSSSGGRMQLAMELALELELVLDLELVLKLDLVLELELAL